MLWMKKTYNGRRPLNIKSWISQQPLIGSYSKFKLNLRSSNQSLQMLPMKTTSKIEDDLEIIKVEYLSNHWCDHTQISFVCSWVQMEDDKKKRKSMFKYNPQFWMC